MALRESREFLSLRSRRLLQAWSECLGKLTLMFKIRSPRERQFYERWD
jgi:hypothetical protein